MKKAIYLLVLVLLASCSQQAQDPNNQGNPGTGEVKSSNTIVEVHNLAPVTFQHFIEINGSVQAEEDAIVSPEIVGQINKIYVEEGDIVKKGQLLVTLNTSITESTIREVKTSLDLAQKTYEKQKQLWEQNIGSEMQFLQAKNNKESLESRLSTLQAQMAMARLRAPFDGVIDRISIKNGELASMGREILHIVNLAEMKIYGDVSESYLPSIHEGDWAEITFPIYPDMKLDERIHRIGQVIDEKSRTFRIEIKLDNKDGKLRPNMISRIRLNDFLDDNALVVPSYIIKQDFSGSFLYVAEKQNDLYIARKTYITPGITYNNQTMVIEGLNENESVIVVGYNLVSAGVEVTVIDEAI
ncbi:MAG: efflux RND transporter periplasmic adaptor subunit [Bacteroidales bacterium]|nr:efflux RND transporter periplasmic adaptor subunit [Bacteroidales bacterium]